MRCAGLLDDAEAHLVPPECCRSWPPPGVRADDNHQANGDHGGIDDDERTGVEPAHASTRSKKPRSASIASLDIGTPKPAATCLRRLWVVVSTLIGEVFSFFTLAIRQYYYSFQLLQQVFLEIKKAPGVSRGRESVRMDGGYLGLSSRAHFSGARGSNDGQSFTSPNDWQHPG